ncbi:Pycsar system effector family protein [Actinomadura atramentaria]|uniref:Pycsar system effector family protein n=1 Tax=Actinomadura atramentaria TaxID=1990 RepID=UPI00037122AE|nr:Pycsar system effector family protein [Actinomadura atramentaria]
MNPLMNAAAVRVLDGELAAVRGELARLDAKTSTLTAVTGVGIAVLTSQISHGPLAVRLVLAAAGITLTAAAIVLLQGVLRPQVGGRGWSQWADLSPVEIEDLFADPIEVAEIGPSDLHILAGIVRRKQRRLRVACDLLVVALALVAVALLAGALTP